MGLRTAVVQEAVVVVVVADAHAAAAAVVAVAVAAAGRWGTPISCASCVW